MMQKSVIVLSPHEAAKKLGITQELLWAYTRYAPKPKDGRKLTYALKAKGFEKDELENWDQYLGQPWAEANEPRPGIPTYVQDYLKVEAGGQCALCKTGHKLQNAHIIPYEDCRNHHHHNLIRLCTDCHSKYDDGIIERSVIQQRKRELIDDIRRRLASEEELPLVLPGLPAADPIFLGRDSELESLFKLMNEHHVVVIHGIGGIGKTQLALRTLERYQAESVVWLDVENFTTLAELRISFDRQISDHFGETITDSNRSQFLARFAGILVFDGLERLAFSSWDDVIDFMSSLIGTTQNAKIVITSQTELIGLSPTPAHMPILEPLDIENSKAILEKHIELYNRGIEVQEADINWLARFTDGHPLSARVICALLGYFKDSNKVKTLLEQQGIDALETPVRKRQLKSTALNICLQAAYECFNHDQKRLLQYLSNFPGGCFVIRAAHWQQGERFDISLAEIRRLHFAHVQPDPVLGVETIKMLNPVRQFVRAEWKANHFEEAAEIQYHVADELAFWASYIVFEKLQTGDLETVSHGLRLADADLPNFIAAMKYVVWGSGPEGRSQNPERYLQLVGKLGILRTYFWLRGDLERGIQFAHLSADAYIKLENFRAALSDYRSIADMHMRLGDKQGFESTAKQMQEIASKIPDEEQAELQITLGDQALQNADYQLALQHYQEAERMYRQRTKDADKIVFGELSLTLSRIGRAHERLHQPEQALKYLMEASSLQIEHGTEMNLGSIHHHMGNCFGALEKNEEAIEAYQKAITIFGQQGSRQYFSNSMNELGDLIVKHGMTSELKQFLSRDLIEFGLKDVTAEIEYSIRRRIVDSEFQPATPALDRKLINIIKLVSFTEHLELLYQWAQGSTDWVQSLGLESISELLDNSCNAPIRLLMAASIAHSIFELFSNEKTGISDEDLEGLCITCYSFSEEMDEYFKLFDWLAALFKYRQVSQDVTAGDILMATFHSVWGISPFKLLTK